jgi:hypothetical protein
MVLIRADLSVHEWHGRLDPSVGLKNSALPQILYETTLESNAKPIARSGTINWIAWIVSTTRNCELLGMTRCASVATHFFDPILDKFIQLN